MEALKWFTIMIIAIIVFTLDAIIGVIYTLVKHLVKRDYKLSKQLAPIFKSIALSFDGLDNACSGERYNDIYLKKKGDNPYGRWDQTISEITGLNARSRNLSVRGKKFRRKLDKVFNFFGEKGSHVLNSIRK